MSEFNVDDFLAGLERDKPQTRGSDRIEKILMNVRDNQGTVVFVPFMNKLNHNFYYKVDRVMEWKGATSKLDSGEAWYKILEKSLYGELSEEDSKLYDQAVSLFDFLYKSDQFDFNALRIRNYTLIYGVLVSHTTTEGDEIKDNEGKPCLFIFTSHDPINALTAAISSKCLALKGNKSWITHILSPKNTGRKGVMSITFSKSANVGYNCNVAFEMNSEFSQIVDPEYVFEEEITKHFENPVRDLVGWAGDHENVFSSEVFKELIIDMKHAIKQLKSENIADGNVKIEAKAEVPTQEPAPSPASASTNPSVDDLPF